MPRHASEFLRLSFCNTRKGKSKGSTRYTESRRLHVACYVLAQGWAYVRRSGEPRDGAAAEDAPSVVGAGGLRQRSGRSPTRPGRSSRTSKCGAVAEAKDISVEMGPPSTEGSVAMARWFQPNHRTSVSRVRIPKGGLCDVAHKILCGVVQR